MSEALAGAAVGRGKAKYSGYSGSEFDCFNYDCKYCSESDKKWKKI